MTLAILTRLETIGAMTASDRKRKPGDIILDRYMPDATAEEREQARENLKALAAVLIQIDARLAVEAVDKELRKGKPHSVES